MGYTNYCEQSRDFTAAEWTELCREATCILVAAASKSISICGPEGNGSPEITTDDIALNGDETKGEDHESFILRRKAESFTFCKTGRKPYDAVVVSVLAAAVKIAPDAIKASSDGGDEAIKMMF